MHQDEGHYAAKHKAGTEMNRSSEEAVKKRIKNDRISCAAAHEAAAEAGVSPVETGRTLDLLEVRINGCQLGLFGNKGRDHGKADLKLPDNPEPLRKAVRNRADNKGISCADLWAAADECGASRMNAAAVCDELGISIRSCQLGAF